MVGVSAAGEGAHKVHVDVSETSARYGDGLHRRCELLCDFALLAVLAILAPGSNVG